jgi:hypothetical protein
MTPSVLSAQFTQLLLVGVSLVEFAGVQRDQEWSRAINDAGFELQALEQIKTKNDSTKMEPSVLVRIESIHRNVGVDFVRAAGKVNTIGTISCEESIEAFAKIVDSLEQIVNSKTEHADTFKSAYNVAKRAMSNEPSEIANSAIKQVYDLIGTAFLTLARQNANYALMN